MHTRNKLSWMEVAEPRVAARRQHATVMAMACALFVPTGLITVMLGPLLPALSARWALNDTQSGYLFTAEFLGSLAGTISCGLVLSRVRFRWAMISGIGLMALGVGMLASRVYVWGLIAVFCYGTGIGTTVPTANLLVAQDSGRERAAALNLLNFFWGAGAVLCPFLLAALHGEEEIDLFLPTIVGFLGLLMIVLLATPITLPDGGPSPPAANRFRWQFPPGRMFLVFGTLFFLYVGTESSLGAWLASYAKRITGASHSGWIRVPAYFYSALLFGRLVASWTLRRISDVKLARIGALVAACSAIALLYAQSLDAIVVSAILVGLGLSTLYPTAIGLATAALGDAASRVMGGLFAFSTLGGACLPWLVGYLSTQFGGLRFALLIPLAGCIAIAALFWNHPVETHSRGQMQEPYSR